MWQTDFIDFVGQTYRTNEQMMQAMKGATTALGAMNKSMNLPQLQRIAMEFEKENDIMDQRQEMMDDAIDDAMETGVEEEGDEVVEQVLEEIGVDLTQAVSTPNTTLSGVVANRESYSSDRHRPAYRQARQWQRVVWPRRKQSEAALTLVKMTFRLGWTA